MAIRIEVISTDVICEYSPYGETEWLSKKLANNEGFTLKGTFHFKKKDLVDTNHNFEDISSFSFKIGYLDGLYYRINHEILDTEYDVLFHYSCSLKLNYFIIVNNYSILKRLEDLANQQIIISNERENSIPEIEFQKIIKSLPTKTEIMYYKYSRITNVISQYLEGIKDYRKLYEKYREKRNQINKIRPFVQFNNYELDKYQAILKTLNEMLSESNLYNEKEWQIQILDVLLLLYPKYIRCFSNVKIKDYYSDPVKPKNRFIDLMLVDSVGNIDVVEIKKPVSNHIISPGTYRDNHTPKRELSGTIMQVEKYLFHLNKWGFNGEKALLDIYQDKLPKQFKFQIVNPKGLVIMGRDDDLVEQQLFDLEIIKRKYANIMDIITYDDLIRRLENLIEKFKTNRDTSFDDN